MSAVSGGPLTLKVYGWLSRRRRAVAYGLYGLATSVSYALAFWVRFEFEWPAAHTGLFLATLPLLIGIRLFTHGLFSLATGRWRYVGISDLFRLLGSGAVGTVLFWGALLLTHPAPFVPRSIILIEWLLTVHLTSGVWVLYRVGFQLLRRRSLAADGDAKRVLIIGAGQAGTRLAHEMITFPAGYLPLGFVDDDPLKWGTRVWGIEVLGSTTDLASIAGFLEPDELVIAAPSLEPAGLRRIVEACERTGLPTKVLPGLDEVLGGTVRVHQLRDVRIDDLLGRQPVQLAIPELAGDFRERTVLITGAAGSIGSELARQVARHGPKHLILLDQAESSLYFVDLELRKRFPEVDVQPVVGDVLDRELMESLFADQRIHRTFHAAAYKHVPLMETNVREAVRNNILATQLLVETAGRNGCERFVLISTDKAVRPSSVMGATKSVAELMVLASQERHPGTSFMAVRFGNVLGSQGSVVPLFREQIEAGDPVTVTHPDATRFFMTIPEAAQLVLQASLLPQGQGRIAMLDMGEPVRILDLARNLIRLSGEHRDPDTRIRYVGLRPGEKLHEELISPREEVIPTGVPKVNLVLRSRAEGLKEVAPWIDRWRLALGDREVRKALNDAWAWCCFPMSQQPVQLSTLGQSQVQLSTLGQPQASQSTVPVALGSD